MVSSFVVGLGRSCSTSPLKNRLALITLLLTKGNAVLVLSAPPFAPFLSGRARGDLLLVLRRRTRGHGGLPARLRISARGAQARESAGAQPRRVPQPRHPGLRGTAARQPAVAHLPLPHHLPHRHARPGRRR